MSAKVSKRSLAGGAFEYEIASGRSWIFLIPASGCVLLSAQRSLSLLWMVLAGVVLVLWFFVELERPTRERVLYIPGIGWTIEKRNDWLCVERSHLSLSQTQGRVWILEQLQTWRYQARLGLTLKNGRIVILFSVRILI